MPVDRPARLMSAGTTTRTTVVPTISRELMAKYDVPGPRYTSYPPVPDWQGAFDATAWARHLRTLQSGSGTLALYVHLPFCVARCLYCGCNATVTTRREVVDRHLDRLAVEMQWVHEAIGTRPRIAEMHWGGGTPNFLDDGQIVRLAELLDTHFVFDQDTARSVEADPRLVTRSQLATFHQLGFRRISYGVQDLDPIVQRAIGREQPESLVRDAVVLAREAGFTGLNLDLIYGLPHQTPITFGRTIDAALTFDPDRVACFGYAHVPWMRPHQKRLPGSALPVAFERFALFRQAVERFLAADYQWIGIDHFARPTDPLAIAADTGTLHRNFMGYTTRPGDHLLGLGSSAISDVHGWYAQNAATLGDWQHAIDGGSLPLARGHVLTDDDQRRGAAITHLMCNAELPRTLWVEPVDRLEERFAAFAADGLVTLEPDRLVVTPLGRFFLRNIAFVLDGYRPETDELFRFSRAV